MHALEGRSADGAPPSGGPIRVLWAIKGLGPGGAERLLVHAARFRDPDVVVPRVVYLVPAKDHLVAELASLGVPARCLGAARSWDPRWLVRLRRELVAEPVDVVHVHSPLVAAGVRLVARTLRPTARPRVVATEHNVWDSHARATSWANRSTLPLDDATIAVSEAVRASMPGRFRARTEVVRYGVDLPSVRARRGERAAVRRELGVADDVVVVATVANLRANKAYPDLLVAARRVVDEAPGTVFVSAGQGPLADALAEQRDALGLGDAFRFLGYLDDATRLLAGVDVFCLASRHEGLPIALLEALALGLPVVATRVGGIPEVVADGREALLVAPGRPEELAAALLALITDPPRRARLADAAATTGDGWSVVAGVRRTEAIYREVTGR